MRPEQHITGDVGHKAVSLIFSEWGWTADTIQSDYGEDLSCDVFIEHHRTPLHFRCQIKSTVGAKNKVRRLKSGHFSVRIATKTLRAWLLAYYPVLLVVYDRVSKKAFWANATNQLRTKVSSLGNREVTLHVNRENILDVSRAEVLSDLTSFYAQLFKVNSESVERTVFPVLMPGYRVVPMMDTGKLFGGCLLLDRAPELVRVHRDSLPAWTTSLRTLDGQFLSGMTFNAPIADLDQFSDLLTNTLSTINNPIAKGEWLAFVCGPIRFSVQRTNQEGESFGRELTGWRSFAKIGAKIFFDREYAFEPSSNFIRQIGRRARSWSGYYFISHEQDIAVQLRARVATTPADRLFQSTLREHMQGQYLPWECPLTEINLLDELLWKAELTFALLDEVASTGEDPDLVRGSINTRMFAPNIGLIPQAQSWAEFELGSVRSQIEKANLLAQLPGREGSPALKEELLALTSHLAEDAPDNWLVDGTNPGYGLPVDLSVRQVLVQRFRIEPSFVPEQAEVILKECCLILSNHTDVADSIHVNAYIIKSFEDIAAITISWSPRLDESSAESLNKVLPEILPVINAAFPKGIPESKTQSTSFDVLRFSGELYFEGDRMY